MQHNRYNEKSARQQIITFYGTTYFIGNITENSYWWYLTTRSIRSYRLPTTIIWQDTKESRILISESQGNTTGRHYMKISDNTSEHVISARREERTAIQNQCNQQQYH